MFSSLGEEVGALIGVRVTLPVVLMVGSLGVYAHAQFEFGEFEFMMEAVRVSKQLSSVFLGIEYRLKYLSVYLVLISNAIITCFVDVPCHFYI